MKLFKNKGFTLIELLVVIAIIGILSSVVLASLNSARQKGADAAIKGDLSNLRAATELYYDDHNSYGGAGGCVTSAIPVTGTGMFNDVSIKNIIQHATTQSGLNNVKCIATATPDAWATSAQLKSVAKHFCVDSLGTAGIRDNSVSTSVCPLI